MKMIKRWLFFVPVFCGILLLVIIVNSKKEPNRPEIKERSRPVKVIKTHAMSIIPKVTGYGYVEPTETWMAIPEVGGRIVEIHPELKRGVFVKKGDVLVRIDPQSYGLAEVRGKATVVSSEAQLRELEQQKENLERLLVIEREALDLAQQELKRKRDLFEKGFLSQSEMEFEEKSILGQETVIKNLLNTLDLIPTQKKSLLARKDSDESSLSELQLDLERTIIRAPFDCRVAEVNVELNQYAAVGSTLLKVINISAVEIPVKLAINEFSNLLSGTTPRRITGENGFSMDDIRNMIGISATVRLPMFGKEASWEAKFMRTSESIDLSTGALTVYVSVLHPYEKIIPAVRPPLVPNLYCEVELQGRKRDDRFVVPVHAVHGGYVHLVDQENRLVKKNVTVEMIMGDFAVIREGLKDDELIVTTDLVPAIEGMLLDPVSDEKMDQRIRAQGIMPSKEMQQ